MYHVLLRHLAPRHPPCALNSLSSRYGEPDALVVFVLLRVLAVYSSVKVPAASRPLTPQPQLAAAGRPVSRPNATPPGLITRWSPLARRLTYTPQPKRGPALSQTPPQVLPVMCLILSSELKIAHKIRLPGRCLPLQQPISFSTAHHSRGHPAPSCGDKGARTPNLRRARAALSQLSYVPRPVCCNRSHQTRRPDQQPCQRHTCLQPPLCGPAWTRTRDLSLIRGAL